MDMPALGDNLTLYAALVGSLVPALVAAINRRSWGSEAKGAAAIAVSIVAGLGTAYLSGHVSGADVTRSVLIVAFLAQVSYQTFWKPSQIAPTIEAATGGEPVPKVVGGELLETEWRDRLPDMPERRRHHEGN